MLLLDRWEAVGNGTSEANRRRKWMAPENAKGTESAQAGFAVRKNSVSNISPING